MIDFCRETGINSTICLGICFCLVLKAVQLIGIEHCFWDSGHPLSLFIQCIE